MPLSMRPIQYRGLINMQGLFVVMKKWFEEHQYEFQEYTVKSKITGDGLRREYVWSAWKRINEYVQYDVKLLMEIRNAEDVEVIRAGEKQKLTQCRVTIEIYPKLTLDPDKRWQGKFIKKLQDFMHNYLIKKEVLYIWIDQLDYRMLKLQHVIQEYLEFESKEQAPYYAAKYA